MPKKKEKRRRKRKSKSQRLHSCFGIRVNHYDASVSADVNYNVYAPEHAIRLDEDDPLYRFQTRLTIKGTVITSEDREGHSVEITVYSDDSVSGQLDLRLKDVQVRDEYGSPEYETYRGQQIPVYKDVKGLALLNKVRGESAWSSWISSSPRMLSDMLMLLQTERQLYISVHEVKESRNRWIRGIELQTIDPRVE